MTTGRINQVFKQELLVSWVFFVHCLLESKNNSTSSLSTTLERTAKREEKSFSTT